MAKLLHDKESNRADMKFLLHDQMLVTTEVFCYETYDENHCEVYMFYVIGIFTVHFTFKMIFYCNYMNQAFCFIFGTYLPVTTVILFFKSSKFCSSFCTKFN